jgi:NDP-sugar pyrophosphorylase family protein
MIQCLILAGGLATRMRPLTENLPKTLIEVQEQPFVHHQLKWLVQHGVTDVIFSIGYKGEMLRDYVKDGSKWGVRAKFVDEGLDLKGTAGAIRKAFDEGVLQPEFFVTYGDSYLPTNFESVFQFFLQQSRPALMTVYKNHGQWDTSNVCYDNGRVSLYSKGLKVKPLEMIYIDYGLLAFRRHIIENCVAADKKQDLADLLYRLSVKDELAGYEVKERFYEIGSPAGLEDFTALLKSERK